MVGHADQAPGRAAGRQARTESWRCGSTGWLGTCLYPRDCTSRHSFAAIAAGLCDPPYLERHGSFRCRSVFGRCSRPDGSVAYCCRIFGSRLPITALSAGGTRRSPSNNPPDQLDGAVVADTVSRAVFDEYGAESGHWLQDCGLLWAPRRFPLRRPAAGGGLPSPVHRQNVMASRTTGP